MKQSIVICFCQLQMKRNPIIKQFRKTGDCSKTKKFTSITQRCKCNYSNVTVMLIMYVCTCMQIRETIKLLLLLLLLTLEHLLLI